MNSLRLAIRNIILENCQRRRYWGVAGSGVVVLCTEDNTIYLQRRSMEVSGGQGQWGFPGGGIHPPGTMVAFYKTPIEERFIMDDNDPFFESHALLELKEEAGYNGIPSYKFLESLISYEDCGFKYKTFIVDISLREKQKWNPEPFPEHEWEIDDQGWFDGETWLSEDIYFGFSPILINRIGNYIG